VKRKLSHSSSINSKLAKKGKRVIVICGPATPVKDVLLDLGSMLSVFYETKGKNFHCKKKGKQNVLNSDYHFGHIRFFFPESSKIKVPTSVAENLYLHQINLDLYRRSLFIRRTQHRINVTQIDFDSTIFLKTYRVLYFP